MLCVGVDYSVVVVIEFCMVNVGVLTTLENNNRVIPCQVNKSMTSSDLDETW